MNKAKSSDPAKFAQALEGLTITDMLGHQVTMRKDDHQILSEYFVGVFTKGVKYDSERHRARLENGSDGARQGPRPAQYLQDEAARVRRR